MFAFHRYDQSSIDILLSNHYGNRLDAMRKLGNKAKVHRGEHAEYYTVNICANKANSTRILHDID